MTAAKDRLLCAPAGRRAVCLPRTDARNTAADEHSRKNPPLSALDNEYDIVTGWGVGGPLPCMVREWATFAGGCIRQVELVPSDKVLFLSVCLSGRVRVWCGVPDPHHAHHGTSGTLPAGPAWLSSRTAASLGFFPYPTSHTQTAAVTLRLSPPRSLGYTFWLPPRLAPCDGSRLAILPSGRRRRALAKAGPNVCISTWTMAPPAATYLHVSPCSPSSSFHFSNMARSTGGCRHPHCLVCKFARPID